MKPVARFPESLTKLRRGRSPIITRGPYAGEPAEVDHIVPVAVAPEFGNWMGNLEFMPRTLNRRKGAKMGERQVSHLKKLIDAAADTKRWSPTGIGKGRQSSHTFWASTTFRRNNYSEFRPRRLVREHSSAYRPLLSKRARNASR